MVVVVCLMIIIWLGLVLCLLYVVVAIRTALLYDIGGDVINLQFVVIFFLIFDYFVCKDHIILVVCILIAQFWWELFYMDLVS